MAKFVNLITKDTEVSPCHFQYRDDSPCCFTTEELGKRCEAAAKIYGPSFFDYLSKELAE